MDYKQHIEAMVVHLDGNNSPENFSKFAGILGHTIAATFAAYIVDHETMHKALDSLMDAISHDACNLHKEIHGDMPDVHMHAAPDEVH